MARSKGREECETYQLIRKVQISNTLEVGPKKIMKRAIDLAFQVVGAARYSESTLSLRVFRTPVRTN